MIDTQISENSRLSGLCHKYGVSTLKIFGSVARNEENENSDIDILVSFLYPVSLLTLVRFERELSEVLGRKVDLITENGLSPYMRDSVLNEAQEIYDVKGITTKNYPRSSFLSASSASITHPSTKMYRSPPSARQLRKS